MGADQAHIAQVLNVEDVGSGVLSRLLLVEFVIDQQVFMVLGQPPLVCVGRGSISGGTDHHGVGCISDVHDGHGILVEAEGNLTPCVLRVGSVVVDDLGVMAVPVFGKASDQGWIERIADVNDVQSA